MLFLNRALKLWHYLAATFVGVILPMLIGRGMAWANPAACYDSPCALPLMLMTTPLVIAPVVALVFAVNSRRSRPFPNGLLPTVLFSAIAGQLGISLWSLTIASPNIRRIFFTDILFMPEGLIVSTFTGALLWIILFVLGSKTGERL